MKPVLRVPACKENPKDNCRPSKEISERVSSLELEELVQAADILNNSTTLYYLRQLVDIMNGGYKLNPIEQRVMDSFINSYNLQYKSPLANAMKESEDNATSSN